MVRSNKEKDYQHFYVFLYCSIIRECYDHRGEKLQPWRPAADGCADGHALLWQSRDTPAVPLEGHNNANV